MRGNKTGPAIKMESDYILARDAQGIRGMIEDNICKIAQIKKLIEEVRESEKFIQMMKAHLIKLADDRQKECIEHIFAGGEFVLESEEEE